jgi:hypothetical protein
MEVSIGRYFKADEQVHHIDGNPLNNELSNLEIVKLGEHQRLHNPVFIKEQKATCVWCGVSFVMTKQHVRHRRDKRAANAPGPFCSRHCTGLYGKSIQLGTTGMNALKFGETLTNGNAELNPKSFRRSVET